jgi:hypothetical protein
MYVKKEKDKERKKEKERLTINCFNSITTVGCE